jgi:hypothetical protein
MPATADPGTGSADFSRPHLVGSIVKRLSPRLPAEPFTTRLTLH